MKIIRGQTKFSYGLGVRQGQTGIELNFFFPVQLQTYLNEKKYHYKVIGDKTHISVDQFEVYAGVNLQIIPGQVLPRSTENAGV